MNAAEPGALAQWQAQLEQGRFVIQRCSDCGRHVFYPREVCPYCWGSSLAWVQPKGSGTVYSTTTVRRKPDAGGDYDVSLIDLDEGVRMMSRVEGIAPTEVTIGMRVKLRIAGEAGSRLAVFEPMGEAR